MSNLERRLRRLEEHHGACRHRHDGSYLIPLINPTEQEVECYKKEVAECPELPKARRSAENAHYRMP